MHVRTPESLTAARLTDAQAERLWRQIAAERKGGAGVVLETA